MTLDATRLDGPAGPVLVVGGAGDHLSPPDLRRLLDDDIAASAIGVVLCDDARALPPAMMSAAARGAVAVATRTGSDAVKHVEAGSVVGALDRDAVHLPTLPMTLPTAHLRARLDALCSSPEVGPVHVAELLTGVDLGDLVLVPAEPAPT